MSVGESTRCPHCGEHCERLSEYEAKIIWGNDRIRTLESIIENLELQSIRWPPKASDMPNRQNWVHVPAEEWDANMTRWREYVEQFRESQVTLEDNSGQVKQI